MNRSVLEQVNLAALPSGLRLAVGAFAGLILGFALLAQVNLWVQDGDGALPGPDRILHKYHGKPGSSRLHHVLDPALPEGDPLAMWPHLGDEPQRSERRNKILAWVEHGAHEHNWSEVKPIFHAQDGCIQCHTPTGEASHVSFETYEGVLSVASLDGGMPLGKLTITAHNHAFGFAVLALLLSVLLCFSQVTGPFRYALIAAAFAGPLLDISGWFLTRSLGTPFQYQVMLGGALFGGSTGLMALLVLKDVTIGARSLRQAAVTKGEGTPDAEAEDEARSI